MYIRTRMMGLSAVMLIFFAVAFMIPMLYPYGSFTDLGGRIAMLDTMDKVAFADLFSRLIYGVGDFLCHQDEARSFIINGSQLAFCHRDVAVFAGFAIGLLMISSRRFLVFIVEGSVENRHRQILIVATILCSVTFIEWAIEFITSFDSPLWRVTTGVITGVGLSLIFHWLITDRYRNVLV